MLSRLLSVVSFGVLAAACSDPAENSVANGSSGAGGLMVAGGGNVNATGGAGASGAGMSSGGVSGGMGGAGGSAGTAVFDPMPTKLSETGLYSDTAKQVLAPGVYEFEPTYALWSDGAVKKRWVYMPPGGKIQTDSIGRGMEYWQYPKGFKLWKEFRRDDKLVETRLLLKTDDGLGSWYMVAFKWNEDHSEALALPDGENNAMGTPHDIPSSKQCKDCHGAMYDNGLGFTALQLSHDLPADNAKAINLAKAVDLGWFNVAPPAAGFKLPGSEVEQKALGYLHANCGMCHNPLSTVYSAKASLDLWTRLDQVQTIQQTRAYLSLVCDQWPGPGGKTSPIASCEAGHATGAPMDLKDLGIAKRVVPKNAAMSGIYHLANSRVASGGMNQMPPLGTEATDPTGLKMITDWINAL